MNRGGLLRWAMAGLLMGGLLALAAQTPARWLAPAVAAWSAERVQWVEPAGSVWQGSAQLVLAGGGQSLDRLALAHRLSWRWGWSTSPEGRWAARLELEHPGAFPEPMTVWMEPAWGGLTVRLSGPEGGAPPELHLPALWLAGLGTPWNTLQPAGLVTLRAHDLRLQWRPGQAPNIEGGVSLTLQRIGSRVSTLPVLGDYLLRLESRSQDQSLQLTLHTRPGSALMLQGQGQWRQGQRFQFQGEARAAEGQEPALSNLLNIIGRRDGSRSVITL